MAQEFANFRELLQNELVLRCKSNPRYSLRAFARYLDVEASALSKIMAGKRGVSKRMISKIGGRLGLEETSIRRYFTQQVFKDDREQTEDHAEFQKLQKDQYEIISNWYHYAILELSRTKNFSPNVVQIATRLGINEWEARDAVDRLRRLDLLDKNYQLNTERNANTTVGTKIDPKVLLNLQKQVLEKAIHSLDTVSMEERDQSAITMAISKSRLGEARAMIKQFRRQLSDFLEGGKSLDEVYNLSISLYPISTSKEKTNPRKGSSGRHDVN